MSRYRSFLFAIVAGGMLACLVFVPLGPLEIFESKTVDVRFWLRERFAAPRPRAGVEAWLLDARARENLQEDPGAASRFAAALAQRARAGSGPAGQRAVGWALPAGGAAALEPALRAWSARGAGAPTVVGRPLDSGAPDGWRAPQQARDGAGTGDLPVAPIALSMDHDGVVRQVPLFLERDDGAPVPTFVLELICRAEGATAQHAQRRGGHVEIERDGVVVRRLPVDGRGRLRINYRRRPAAPAAAAREAPAFEPPEPIAGARALLVGLRDPAFADRHATPLAVTLSQGEIVAEALETALAGDPIRRVPLGVQFLLVWLLIVAGAGVMLRLRSYRSVLAGLGLLVVWFVLEKAAFLGASVWFDFLRPMLALQGAVIIFPVYAYRKRTRRLLDEMRLMRRFDDLVLMNISRGLIVAGRGGQVLRHNPPAAALLGCPGESLHGRHLRELFAMSPATLEIIGQAMAARPGTGGAAASPARRLPIATRVALPSGDGAHKERLLDVEVTLVDPQLLVTREDDDLPCYVLTFEDVTEEVEHAQEEALRARLAAMGEIAAKLGHEIRNSLGGLRLYIENVRDDLPPGSTGHDAIGRMLQEIESLYRKIDQLRQYGSNANLQRERCSLRELLEEALTFASHKLGDKHVHAVLECDRSLPPVAVDRRQMREAFQNLINNAIEAAPEGGRVKILAERVGQENGMPAGSYCIHVEDNGPGIAPDVREQVFSLFFTTKPDIGTGLGLPMVRKIVESHGGEVTFGDGEDGGARFTVKLPASAAGEE